MDGIGTSSAAGFIRSGKSTNFKFHTPAIVLSSFSSYSVGNILSILSIDILMP